MDQWVSQRQAAEEFGVTSQTIRLWVLKHPGCVTVHKVGRFKFYYLPDLYKLEAKMFQLTQ